MSSRYPRALLFDLDGTLLDSAPDLTTAVNRMRADLGFAPVGEPQVRGWVGEGARRLVQTALADALGLTVDAVPAGRLDAALAVFLDHYDDCCTERSRLYSGVETALSAWRDAGIAMACVTNKPARFTGRLLTWLGLADLLPVSISGDTLPQRKPAPEPLLYACELLDSDPAATMMVGDSRNDVLAARAAGIAVACVGYGYNHGRPVALERPDLLAADFAELREILARHYA